MTRFAKWVTKWVETWFGIWHEGPEPPRRLSEVVLRWMDLHPQATRKEWASFAMFHAHQAYRSGWARGYEWSARQDSSLSKVDPEALADRLDPSWRLRPWEPADAMALEVMVGEKEGDLEKEMLAILRSRHRTPHGRW